MTKEEKLAEEYSKDHHTLTFELVFNKIILGKGEI